MYIGDYVKIKDTNIEGYITSISSNYIAILSNDKIVKSKIDNIEALDYIPKVSTNIKVKTISIIIAPIISRRT